MSLGLFLLLYFCLCFIPPPASPASTSAFTCPFTLTANRSIDLSNRADEMLRREVTEEEFDEELAALVWCLPKTYVVERPPFLGTIWTRGSHTTRSQHLLQLFCGFAACKAIISSLRAMGCGLPGHWGREYRCFRYWVSLTPTHPELPPPFNPPDSIPPACEFPPHCPWNPTSPDPSNIELGDP